MEGKEGEHLVETSTTNIQQIQTRKIYNMNFLKKNHLTCLHCVMYCNQEFTFSFLIKDLSSNFQQGLIERSFKLR